MLSATDSFIQYLSAGLSVPVYFVRASADDATSSVLKMDALNVSILRISEISTPEDILVSLDLLGTDLRMALGQAKTLRDKLIEQQYTPELDFESDPVNGTPVAGHYVYWEGRYVEFHIIRNEPRYVHLNCTFKLHHVR